MHRRGLSAGAAGAAGSRRGAVPPYHPWQAIAGRYTGGPGARSPRVFRRSVKYLLTTGSGIAKMTPMSRGDFNPGWALRKATHMAGMHDSGSCGGIGAAS